MEEKVKKRSLRVLMVTGVYPTEARPHAGTFIKTLVEALREAGIRVEVIHPAPGPVLWRYLLAILQIWWKVCTGTIDIVHGHYGQWCFFARLQWKVPVVAAFLGDDLLGTVTARGGHSLKGALIVRLSRWLCGHVDVALVKSAEMRAVTGNPTVQVLSDGVDFKLFRPLERTQLREELGWQQDRYYALFGNNPAIPVKNIQLARAAIEYLVEQGVSAELVVANGLPQAQLVRYINACNAVALPSHAEGSPNIVKEAMACNVPVVATDVGDVSDVIWSTQGCSICSPDPASFALGLLHAFQQHEPTTGREDIAHLEVSLIAQQMIAMYRRIQEGRYATQHRQKSMSSVKSKAKRELVQQAEAFVSKRGK